MNIQLITFDLDNTLWDVDSVIRRAEAEMRAWISPRVPEYDVRFESRAVFELRKEVIEADPTTAHDISKLRIAVMFEAFKRCDVPETEARNLAAGAFEVFMHWRNEVEFFEGALETLEALSKRYRLASLTNGNANIGRIGLDRYFAFGISAADVAASKPDPAMFHAALERTGLEPAQAVHVGDNAIDDVEGANAVGMHTVWVDHRGEGSEVVASATVTDLPSLLDVIDGLSARSTDDPAIDG